MSDQTVQNIQIKIKPLEKNAPGFLPMWRKMLSAKRSMMDPMRAQPEDVDDAIELLCGCITEPEDRASKEAILNSITADEFGKLFDAIMRAETVPPPNGAPSVT